MSIPKKIHYCWYGDKPLPFKAVQCIKSWNKHCPEFEIIEWNEKNSNIQKYSFSKEAYKRGLFAYVSDVMRLDILKEHGGIYLDVDVELIKPIDDLLDYDGFFSFESSTFIATGLGFGTIKSNPVITKLLNIYKQANITEEIENDTLLPCPQRDSKVFETFGFILNDKTQIINNNIILSSEYFDPKSPQTGLIRLNEHTYAIHHYQMSWMTKKERKRHKVKHFYYKYFGKRLGEVLFRLHNKILLKENL